MTTAGTKSVAEHRKRLKQRGLARVELRVPKEDAPLLREIAAALADTARAPEARRRLRENFPCYAGMNFKELLAAAPLDLDLDFERAIDRRREIDF
jgi:hypothetical protein